MAYTPRFFQCTPHLKALPHILPTSPSPRHPPFPRFSFCGCPPPCPLPLIWESMPHQEAVMWTQLWTLTQTVHHHYTLSCQATVSSASTLHLTVLQCESATKAMNPVVPEVTTRVDVLLPTPSASVNVPQTTNQAGSQRRWSASHWRFSFPHSL